MTRGQIGRESNEDGRRGRRENREWKRCDAEGRAKGKKCPRLASVRAHENSSRGGGTKPRHTAAVIIDLGASLHFASGRAFTGSV